MQVRAARPTDILGIAEVHVRSWQETYVGQVPQDYLDTLSVEDRYERWQELVADIEWPALDLLVSIDRKSTRLNSSHRCSSYAVFCWKKKTRQARRRRQGAQ